MRMKLFVALLCTLVVGTLSSPVRKAREASDVDSLLKLLRAYNEKRQTNPEPNNGPGTGDGSGPGPGPGAGNDAGAGSEAGAVSDASAGSGSGSDDICNVRSVYMTPGSEIEKGLKQALIDAKNAAIAVRDAKKEDFLPQAVKTENDLENGKKKARGEMKSLPLIIQKFVCKVIQLHYIVGHIEHAAKAKEMLKMIQEEMAKIVKKFEEVISDKPDIKEVKKVLEMINELGKKLGSSDDGKASRHDEKKPSRDDADKKTSLDDDEGKPSLDDDEGKPNHPPGPKARDLLSAIKEYFKNHK